MNKKVFGKIVFVLLLVLNQFIAVGYGVENNPPAIGLTYVPKYGSTENLQGRVLNADPKDFAVAVYIEVDGGWWTKPYWDSPVTKINNDKTWVCDITTGGIDETATRIVAYLIPRNYQPPLATGDFEELPQELEEKALAKAEARRGVSGNILLIGSERSVQIKDVENVRGFCYGPFWDNENPDMGVFPLLEGLKTDIGFIPNVSPVIRTYGCANTLSSIPELCEKVGVDCYVGAWLSKYKIENGKEVESIIQIANKYLKSVKSLIIGNEVLLRKDMTEDELVAHIRQVKKSTKLPVTTAEIWSVWVNHRNLANEVDFLTIHIHPYWEGIPVEKAAEYVVKTWKDMKNIFPGKRIVIGETGWPSKGKDNGQAVPSEKNQARFFREFSQLAEEKGIEYFYFQLFDEKWKDKFEGKVGAYWGIYNSDGSLKTNLKELVSAKAAEGIIRPPRRVLRVKVVVPFVVYLDAGSNENKFQPSGWMGDTDFIDLDRGCETNPHSAKTCVRITYNPGGFFSQGWSGIYWQYPLNNWGEYPGYDLVGASKLTFWIRGEKGDEMAEFKVGGINNFGEPNRDSFGPVSTDVIKLTQEWKKYTIDLKKEDTSNVIGGFCWATNHWQNPKGCTIYLDDIQFEP